MKLMKQPAARTRPQRDELERVLDRMLSPSLMWHDAPLMETEWAPSLDFSETDKEFVVRLEAPAIHRENLDVGFEENMLTISGRREFRKEHETEEFIWKEREEGRFVRTVRVPKAVDAESIQATYDNGVLTVRLAKKEPAIKTKIAIK